MKRVLVPVVLVLLVAAAARVPGLGRGLWYDELFTVANFADALPHALFAQRQANNHPLASVLAWLVSFLGDEPWVLRLPSLLLGTLAVLSLPREAGEGRRGGAWFAGALLAASHPAHVAHSQEVRGYAAVLLFAPLATGLALEGKRPRALAACVALGLYAHLSMLPLVLALPFASSEPLDGARDELRESRRRSLLALAAGTLAALALYAPMLSHLAPFAAKSAGAGGPDGLARVLELFTTGDARLAPPLLGAPLLALAALGALRARRLALVAGTTAALIALGVLAFRPLFHARFALVLLPLVLALAGHGAETLARGRRAVLVVAPLVAILAVASARRAPLETEPVAVALRAYPGARFEFVGTGAELHESAKDPTHRVELFAREEEAQFHGLYAHVKVTPLR